MKFLLFILGYYISMYLKGLHRNIEMSLIAAFLWRKSPKLSICTLMFDSETMKIISSPKIVYFSKKLFSFRSEAKQIINEFVFQLMQFSKVYKNIFIEFKIVFDVSDMSWFKVSNKSRFVNGFFIKSVAKIQRTNPHIKLRAQLRQKLSGRALKHFKRELRLMNLVSRRRDTGFEYHLWTVALHATPKTYEKKLQIIKKKLFQTWWNEPEDFY